MSVCVSNHASSCRLPGCCGEDSFNVDFNPSHLRRKPSNNSWSGRDSPILCSSPEQSIRVASTPVSVPQQPQSAEVLNVRLHLPNDILCSETGVVVSAIIPLGPGELEDEAGQNPG